MTIRTLLAALLLTMAFGVRAESHLSKNPDSQARLMVDGKPFLILGGELGNSSASSPDDIARIFPKLKRMGLNTVLVPMYWDLLEPAEGRFDFTLSDAVVDQARADSLKVVFLWFGAWKNSMSCYTPMWVKTDTDRFPRVCTSQGKPLEICTPFSDNIFKADSTALSTWLNHLTAYDRDGTVIMLQLENEIGMVEEARDHCALADAEFAKSPEAGGDIYAQERFMARQYARYVESLAQTARRYTEMPLYVNAALNSRGRKPGEYPSAGPLAHLADIWKSEAPTVDMFSPDIYDSGFTDWLGQYDMPDNPLFIPEIRREAANGAQTLYAVGEHGAIGFSPFSIENGSDDTAEPLTKGYALLTSLWPLIKDCPSSLGKTSDTDKSMCGLYFEGADDTRVVETDSMRITARHYFTLPWDPRATDGSPWPKTGAILLRLAPREYILAGTGVVVKFEKETEHSAVRRLGEDGYEEAAEDIESALKWHGGRVGIGTVDEVEVNPDGTLRYIRRDNGDETHQGRHVRISPDQYRILHIKLYDY